MQVVRSTPFPTYNPIGQEEVEAAAEVVRTGMLSNYVARHGDSFSGGKYVKKFEQMWADYHQVKYAVSFNTATTGLVAAIGALGILPGDEVIVISYSMCISATAPLFWDAIPVFVDIEEDCFCIDPKKIEAAITPKTKAILSVDLFGQSADMIKINEVAKKHNLKVISDASHVPGCKYLNGFAGTFADIGVYSLNQHKIIHCGEGGVAVTNDEELALRLKLIRNHAEAVVGDMKYKNITNMLGSNYRLGEMESAVAIEQLKKLKVLIKQRQDLANYLTEKIEKIPFLVPPKVRNGSDHVYYLYPILFNKNEAKISRSEFVDRIRNLGIPLYKFAEGYIKPLYFEPIFANKEEFKNGFPWSLNAGNNSAYNYRKGLNPVVEDLYDNKMIVTAYNYPPLQKSDMDDIVKAFILAGSGK